MLNRKNLTQVNQVTLQSPQVYIKPQQLQAMLQISGADAATTGNLVYESKVALSDLGSFTKFLLTRLTGFGGCGVC